MNTLAPFCSLQRPCDEALQWTKEQLSHAGLRAMQTFDLHAARHAPEACICPYHGMHKCDCQMVVLLVYGNTVEPVTLVLHGNDGQTWISLVDTPHQHTSAKVVTDIRHALG